jgi:hypothetical protein
MSKILLWCFLLILFITSIADAIIINIPADFPEIQIGINAAGYGDTVLVQPGTYNENLNLHGINFTLGSLFLTTGDTSYIAGTIIDGGQNGRVINMYHHDSSTVITGFTIQNGKTIESNAGGGIGCLVSSPTIINNIIRNNRAEGVFNGSAGGGGIYCDNSSAKILNNRIFENVCSAEGGQSITNGAGIYITGTSDNTIIANNVIYDNRLEGTFNRGGGISCGNTSNVIITNNTIYNNSDEGIYGFNADITITNSIIWNNSLFFGDSTDIIITYSDIENGWEGEGNIDENPMFRDSENNNFHLMASYCGDSTDSPCIDAGDPSIYDSFIDCEWGLETERSDIGAYGGDRRISTDLNEETSSLPHSFILYQNYPNPFNAKTTIKYYLLSNSFVRIEVYNIAGQSILTLIDKYESKGEHKISWDASEYSSGIYIYKLTLGNQTFTKRMTLLK